MLAPLRPGHDYRPALDEAVGLGWNLLRTFCGALPWCGQAIGHVYANLPTYLGECQARGLNSYLAYHTEAGTGYDLERHTDEVEAIARAYPQVVLREVANEADHPTQGGRLDPERCADLADRMDGPVSMAPRSTDDESDRTPAAITLRVHLDRGRDPWNMVRRVREIYAHTERFTRPANNQEPIGAAEQDEAGSRCADPAIFHTMAALNRLFDVTADIFHSDDGLHANRLGPRQLQCAQAFGAGSRVWPTGDVLSYRNAGHEGSPVRGRQLRQGDPRLLRPDAQRRRGLHRGAGPDGLGRRVADRAQRGLALGHVALPHGRPRRPPGRSAGGRRARPARAAPRPRARGNGCAIGSAAKVLGEAPGIPR